ncbi:DUF1127 domain-containing protein [Rhizobium sp. TRM95111]|uniref:DUF1127 domain-containing protein n=1 Tax=Rhizobium alarense TaxID=2846851 RepID=UPI001F3F224F|nr:DUF1127 domain-containing protein [Rhizobium alarense]MCF3639736.1 DUF1127 domain-containing protein [Rhizobium alarense]
MTIDTISHQGSVSPLAEPRSGIRSLAKRALLAYWSVRTRSRSRRVLADLTDEQLRDVGLTRAEAEREASKSFFWDV